MTKRQKKRLIRALLALLVFILGALSAHLQQHPQSVPVQLQAGFYRVSEFEDGDTIVVDMNGTKEKVRFIGIDTPETKDPRKPVQCFGPEASAHTKEIIGTQSVRLEADPPNTDRDRYGRLLRYIYLSDGTLVNLRIVQDGYGFAYVGFPVQKLDQIKAAEADARQARRGLWAVCNPTLNANGGYTSNPQGS